MPFCNASRCNGTLECLWNRNTRGILFVRDSIREAAQAKMLNLPEPHSKALERTRKPLAPFFVPLSGINKLGLTPISLLKPEMIMVIEKAVEENSQIRDAWWRSRANKDTHQVDRGRQKKRINQKVGEING